MNGKACITGGAGFVGKSLATALIKEGYHPVVLIDCSQPPENLEKGLHFIQADVRDKQTLANVFTDASVVFHIASFGMSGSTQLQRKLVREINVGGTNAVISAAIDAKVERLVVTSTYNVVFGSEEIEGGDETLPYFPLHRHPDEYSRSKAEAEAAVLAANMTPLHSTDNSTSRQEKQRYLRTCSIRPAAIWAAGEKRHMPRVVSYVERGLFCFVFGKSEAKMDFVHVNNLVQAHVAAARALNPKEGHRAAGQAYFISDGEHRSINNFEFFRQIVEGLGYDMPTIRLPLQLVYFLAFFTEVVHGAMSPLIPFEPLLTRAEVLKAGVSHWFLINKARKDLGYVPIDYSFDEVVRDSRSKGHGKRCRASVGSGDGDCGSDGGGLRRSALWEAMMVLFIALQVLRLVATNHVSSVKNFRELAAGA